MKTHYILRQGLLYFIMGLFCQVSLLAQPVLTSDNYPQIGDQFTRITVDEASSTYDISNTGEDAVWDFSGLEPFGAGATGQFVDPSGTDFGAEYPSSTVAEATTATTNYYEVDDSGAYWVGRADPDGTLFDYTDPQTEMMYPFTFGSAYVDTAHRSYDVGAVVGSRIIIDREADGYGTLILPIGTFENVLRIKVLRSYRDTIPSSPGSFFYGDYENYEFYREEDRYPLLSLSFGTINQSGEESVSNVISYSNLPQEVDAYGYTQTSSEDTGESCDWIDITTIGTEVDGLADDNSVGPIDMGIDFQYYWTTTTELWVGSNGYLAFNPINISSTAIGFPNIPTQDEQNDFIAPFMADLNFSGTSNPGKVYTHTNNDDQFIVSFHDVPFWTGNADGFIGSNTFQVIFSASDSSIVYNYLEMAETVADEYLDNANPVIIGIENISGDIGIQVSNTLPASNSCIRFDPPNVPLIDVVDVYPSWNQNSANGGFFEFKNSIVQMQSKIKNVGNVTIDESFTVTSQVLRSDNSVFDNYSATIDGLEIGESKDAIFELFPAIEEGTFTFRVNSGLEDDNPNNDTNDTELIVVDSLANGEIPLSYGIPSPLTVEDVISWNGANGYDDGCAVYIEPPFYPFEIVAGEFYVLPSGTETAITAGFKAQVVAADASGIAGDVLAEKEVTAENAFANLYNRVDFDEPVIIESGGFYMTWLMEGTGISLGLDVSPPYSRRSYEILSSTYAPYRENSVRDFFIKAIGKEAQNVGINDNVIDNWEIGQAYPNPTNDYFTISCSVPNSGKMRVEMVNVLGQVVSAQELKNMSGNTQMLKIHTQSLLNGMYWVNFYLGNSKQTRSIVVAR